MSTILKTGTVSSARKHVNDALKHFLGPFNMRFDMGGLTAGGAMLTRPLEGTATVGRWGSRSTTIVDR